MDRFGDEPNERQCLMPTYMYSTHAEKEKKDKPKTEQVYEKWENDRKWEREKRTLRWKLN